MTTFQIDNFPPTLSGYRFNRCRNKKNFLKSPSLNPFKLMSLKAKSVNCQKNSFLSEKQLPVVVTKGAGL